MIVVIIAGGSGTRLWPLSTAQYPKHLLKLFGDRSLLQNAFDRVRQITSLDKILIVPEASHIEHVYEQLPELPKDNILVEPARRGTASCVLLALQVARQRAWSNEAMLILWADHVVRDADGFAATVLKAANLAESARRLVFIGVEPTYPSTGLGYMQRDGAFENWQDVFILERFQEKPDKRTAEKFLASGNYYWNTGYLVGTPAVMEQAIAKHAPKMHKNYTSLLAAKTPAAQNKAYLGFESEALEFALSERITDGLLVPGRFDWADVGSFNDLHSMNPQDDDGNHVHGKKALLEGVTNSYVRNDTNVPLAVVGLDNVVVVSSPNGVVVANKNFSQKIGDVAKRLASE